MQSKIQRQIQSITIKLYHLDCFHCLIEMTTEFKETNQIYMKCYIQTWEQNTAGNHQMFNKVGCQALTRKQSQSFLKDIFSNIFCLFCGVFRVFIQYFSILCNQFFIIIPCSDIYKKLYSDGSTQRRIQNPVVHLRLSLLLKQSTTKSF